FSSRRRHTRCLSDWSSDVCSSDLNALIHEIFVFPHVEQNPAQVVNFKHRKSVRHFPNGLFECLSVGPDSFLSSWFRFRDNREPMTGWRSRKHRAIPSLL